MGERRGPVGSRGSPLYRGGGPFWGEGVVKNCFSVVQGRVLLVDFDWRGFKFRLLNVYAPADPVGRRELVSGLDVVLCTTRFLILGGDFNLSLDGGAEGSIKILRSLMNGFQLVDSHRVCNGQRAGFTWANTRGSQSRIDYILGTRRFRPCGFLTTRRWP